MKNLLTGYDALLADLDGVIYTENEPIPHATNTINKLKIPIAYLTNNASRSPQQIATHLKNIGINQPKNIITSVQAAIKILQQHVKPNTKILTIGSEYLKQQITQANFTPINQHNEKPQAIIQGFDPNINWKDLAQIAYATQNNNIPWVATNSDLTIPQKNGLAPGNGSLIATITNTTHKTPLIAGKPKPTLFHIANQQLQTNNPLMVGDRLDTDILGANNANIHTALVLTGVNTAWDALTAPNKQQPTYLIENLQQLTQNYPKIVKKNNKHYCENSWAQITNHKLTTNFNPQQPYKLNLARAICAAWWATPKTPNHPNPICEPEIVTYLQKKFIPK